MAPPMRPCVCAVRGRAIYIGISCSGWWLHWGAMTEPIATEEITVEEDANGVPTMTTVERAQLLLDQDAAITARIQEGATLD